jgi:hypothetical protein
MQYHPVIPTINLIKKEIHRFSNKLILEKFGIIEIIDIYL